MSGQRNRDRHRVSYSHYRISDVLDTAKGLMEKHRKILSEAVSPVPTYNGFITDPKLVEFCMAVRKEVPGIKFAPTHTNTGIKYNVLTDSAPDYKFCYAVSTFGGYFDGDPYSSVKLIIHDDEYVVSSRTISNNKYKCDTSDFYTARSKTLPAAVNAFKKHFRRISPEEIATEGYSEVTSKALSYVRDLSVQQSIALRGLYENSAFLQYIRSAVQGDVPPEHVAKSVMPQAEQYIQATDALADAKNASSNMLYVQIGTVGGVTYSVVPYDKTTTKVTAARIVIDNEDKLEEMFPGALGRIAVLAMTDIDTFVDKVGMRAHENCFWVVR